MQFFILLRGLMRHISGSGTGCSLHSASKSCALALVSQLHRLGLIKAFTGTLKENKDEEELTPYPVKIDPVIMLRVRNCVEELNLPVVTNFLIKSDHRDSNTVILFAHKITPRKSEQKCCVIPGALPQQIYNVWDLWKMDEGYLPRSSPQQLSEDLEASARDKRMNDKVYQMFRDFRESLPVAAMRGRIMSQINENPVVIVRGNTGCGKTTQIPQYVLDDHGIIAQGKTLRMFHSLSFFHNDVT